MMMLVYFGIPKIILRFKYITYTEHLEIVVATLFGNA
jgi:hypothetical protein